MAFSMNLWRVSGASLELLAPSRLHTEQRLEDWIAKDPGVLGMDLLIVGRQIPTPFAGRIDLLALDADANCVILELKRDRSPREVVAQVLDYASWVKDLGFDELDQIATAHIGKPLAEAFSARFEDALPEAVNTSHSMVVVASELDDSSERIIDYLADTHELNINAVFFTIFKAGDGELLGRAWLKDPAEFEQVSHKRTPWSGYWFVNVGESPKRTWDDNRRCGYLSAGGGAKYSTAMKRLHAGDQVFAYLRGQGYVGFGRVQSEARMIRDFIPATGSKPLLELPLTASLAGQNSDNPDLCEWVVGVRWQKTFAHDEARTFRGAFANQNVVCKIRQQETVEFLRREFGAD
jgi:hypothetical protein